MQLRFGPADRSARADARLHFVQRNLGNFAGAVSMAPYTDEAAIAMSTSMEEAEQMGLFSCVKGCLIGTGCSSTRIVSVAVHPGFEDHPRNIDLYVEMYIEPNLSAVPRVVKLEETSYHCVRRYPYDSAMDQPFFWTIYFISKERQTSMRLPRNNLFDTFKIRDPGQFGIPGVVVSGNILVVKADRRGLVQDVLERDLFFVERLLYSFFEDDAYVHGRGYRLIVTSNPLIRPESPSRAKWYSGGRGWA
ncbi:hypothetical protein FA13DRAFT_1802296 [Coprinellus micaceus]|uniref:Uncharacterized protein n=1 Tax=Coprinellus micaceus TaxID=71717 RepID=A0A4Y7SDH4_COPMI|nr:hypothetical protein FA13DRAFT_1802296 [Coprinellus micaceus]